MRMWLGSEMFVVGIPTLVESRMILNSPIYSNILKFQTHSTYKIEFQAKNICIYNNESNSYPRKVIMQGKLIAVVYALRTY